MRSTKKSQDGANAGRQVSKLANAPSTTPFERPVTKVTGRPERLEYTGELQNQ